MSAYTILMTKKVDPALVKKAKDENIELKEIEFTEIVERVERKKVMEIAEKACSVVFTSKNSVIIVNKHLGKIRPDWKIYCIDGGTRDKAVAFFGEESIAGVAVNARELAAVIAANDTEKEIVFFCGERRRDELPDFLDDQDVDVEEIVVYETRLAPQEVGQHFEGIAFFSPSAVESFFSVNVIADLTVFFAIGPTTAESLKKFAENKVITCSKASEEVMVDTIISYIKETNG